MFEIQKKKKKKTVQLVSYLGILLVKMPENEAARKFARKSQENKDRERESSMLCRFGTWRLRVNGGKDLKIKYRERNGFLV